MAQKPRTKKPAPIPDVDALDPADLGWVEVLVDLAARDRFCQIDEVTPGRARALMTRNSGNRNLSRGIVNQIANDLKNGRWQFNGESVVLSREGELNDGQHRLQAIAESGRTVSLVIVGGATRASRMTLDMGRTRSISDFLTLSGVHYATTIASAVRLAIAYEQSGGKHFETIRSVSKAEAAERGLTDQAMTEAAEWVGREQHATAGIIPGSPLAFCAYVLRKIDPAAAEKFMTGLATGASLPDGSPILTARRHLINYTSRNREPKIALVLRAWHYWRTGAEHTPADIHGRFPLPDLEAAEGPADEKRRKG